MSKTMFQKMLKNLLDDIEKGVIGIIVNSSKPSNEQMNTVRAIRKYFKEITKKSNLSNDNQV